MRKAMPVHRTGCCGHTLKPCGPHCSGWHSPCASSDACLAPCAEPCALRSGCLASVMRRRFGSWASLHWDAGAHEAGAHDPPAPCTHASPPPRPHSTRPELGDVEPRLSPPPRIHSTGAKLPSDVKSRLPFILHLCPCTKCSLSPVPVRCPVRALSFCRTAARPSRSACWLMSLLLHALEYHVWA